MFHQKTVFVVGAGGSKEVGLPIGDGLRDRIGEKLKVVRDARGGIVDGDEDVIRALRHMTDESGTRVPRIFYDLAEAISQGMPQSISIDNYLHFHSANSKLVEVGKLGIAASILEAEAASSIATERSKRLSFRDVPDSWHNTFCKMLTEGITASDVQDIFDNVTIITFNYDRVIEHYVCEWLCSYMRIDIAAAEVLTQKLKVIHPYGTVGALPWQTKGPIIPFGKKPDAEDLIKSSQNLRTFTEGSNDPGIDYQIENAMSQAEQVVFLGFSYLPLNLELLKFDMDGPRKRAYGTSLGMSEKAKAAARNTLNGDLAVAHGHPFEIDFTDSTCNKMLNDYWRVLV